MARNGTSDYCIKVMLPYPQLRISSLAQEFFICDFAVSRTKSRSKPQKTA